MNARWISLLCIYIAIGSYGCNAGTGSEVSSDKAENTIQSTKDYPIQPVPFTDVSLTDEFWAPRIETNRKVSIPYAFGKCEETGRIDNFAIAGGLMKGEHRGNFPFDDTDPYKILEGAAYSLSVHPDAKLDKYLDDLIIKIAAAQEDDGYLYTCRTNNAKKLADRWFGEKRWSKLNDSHELYNMGHLYEAAVAHYQAAGKRTLLDVAVKNADMLDTVFGPGKNETAPGHQIIEMGLARLYRATGDEKYRDLAKFFLDTRGPGGKKYNQSHQKVVDQTEAAGHAVRATYMYCGMADVAALTGDRRYLEATDKIWENVVSKKLYLTGGIGATSAGESFGTDYYLPNLKAYCETCAAIGNVMWNQRMFLSHGDAKYIDVLERTLYNGLISGVSLSGDEFFYPNPLESDGRHKRSAWFSCACCPGNITRFIPSVPGYIYAHTQDKLYVNLFVSSSAAIKLKNNTVKITQETNYPWAGKVKMTVEPQLTERFTICIRIPGWARNKPVPSDLYRFAKKSKKKAALNVNGEKVALNMKNGFACIERRWSKGDTITLNLPMPVRRVLSHEKVQANTDRVALQRGPIVYCAEGIDNGGNITNLLLKDKAELKTKYQKDLLNGVTTISGKAVGLCCDKNGNSTEKEQDFIAVPYYSWANRGAGEMAVWLARDESAAKPLTPPTTTRQQPAGNTTPSVKIDAAKTGEPISKYIYGQFIEHLGRCIYGGIWAEMLEDRKFYFPITADYDPYRNTGGVPKTDPFAVVGASPWQITGDDDSVVMVRKDCFVGEHTPLIQPDSGIRQLDLGLVKDRQYLGYIYLKAKQQKTNVTVSLLWGDKPKDKDTIRLSADSNRYVKRQFRFTSRADTTKGKLEIKVSEGPCFIGTVSLMPADNIEGMRADTLELLKELNAPIYRWPGGNFVSGYDWRDGIGDRDKRPPRKNPAWTGVEHNDFGFHEFIRFCRLVDAEPLVTVNTGFGDAYSAAAQLEYSNGSKNTLMGSLRAKNGGPEPFDVRYWAIGNEMFGSWQLGHMKLEHYVLKHNWIVDKMREVDPDIVPIASGNAGSWSEGLLRNCPNHIDLIAEHFYCREKSNLLEHTSQIADEIRKKVQFHRQLREKWGSLKSKDIKIAMTEWNYWYGPYLFGELGTRYFHKDALGIARGLHEYFRNSNIIFLANYAQTVNVIGCIKTSKTSAAFETTGLALKLYRNHFGTLPVEVTGETGGLDIAAAWTSNKKTLTIAIVNPSGEKTGVAIDLQNAELAGTGKLLYITHSDPMAYNEPGKELQVVIEEKSLSDISGTLNAPPLGISLYKLDTK